MNSLKKVAVLAGLAGGLLLPAQGQPADQPAPDAPPPPAQNEPTNGSAQAPAPPATPDMPEAPPQPVDAGGAPEPADAAPSANGAQSGGVKAGPAVAKGANSVAVSPAMVAVPSTNANFGDKGLRLNFRNVPLDMVLNYMSDAAGFIIVLETKVEGTVDVWSNQPLSKDEAVRLLNTVLNKNGYAAIQDGRTLTILSREDARKRDIPVNSGNNPAAIPKSAAIVTQILPVRSLNATQLTKDLAPLLPSDTVLTANEAGNALIMTDTQVNIRRMAEIIKALDSVSSSVNSIRVFPLQYSDSKTMVNVIKELFPSQDQGRTGGNNNQAGGRFPGMFGGGPFAAMMGGGRGGNNNNSGNSAQKAAARVLAVSDDNSNTVIVSAPDDILPLVDDLIKSLDVPMDDVTELRVFRLKYSDPTEMSELLTSLFPDDSTSNTSGGGNRFQGPFGMFGGNRGNNNNSNQSDRAKRKGRVIAVPDARTASVVVSADKTLMFQIASMVDQLDANPAKKQRVFVYSLQNANVQDVENILNDLFQSNNSRNSRTSSSQTSNPLTTRAQQMQQYNTTTSGFGSSSGNGGRNAP